MDPAAPAPVLALASGFMASKAVLAAVKLGVPAALAAAPGGALPYHDLCAAVGIRHGPAFRGSLDFLDLLVALGVLAREGGPGPGAAYRCASPQVAEQLGGSDGSAAPGLVFMNDRLYRFWGGLEASLRTGEAQSEARAAAPGGSLFDALRGGGEADVEAFAQAMTALNLPHIRALAASAFDFSGRAALADIGGSAGALCAVLARAHPHLLCTTYDRAELAPVAGRYLEREGLAGQVQVQVGVVDFWAQEELPCADVITMSRILHDWGLPRKLELMRKAHAALPEGGAFIAMDSVIDDERRTSVAGLTMSLNMLIETGPENAFDYTYPEFQEWAAEVGFARTELLPLTASVSACVAFK